MAKSDYESYWSDREGEGQEDGPQPDVDPYSEVISESYDVEGETIDVEIDGAWATFRYANGTVNTVPVSDLYVCPRCIREGEFPFCFDTAFCPVHEHDLIKFDRKEYESFKIVAQMNGGLLAPQ
ncbi:MAG: hypothetical protein L0Z54_05650 [Thermoplasmata archaeon]|nr:hypothetical protein [Thermoplasmata archaeon]